MFLLAWSVQSLHQLQPNHLHPMYLAALKFVLYRWWDRSRRLSVWDHCLPSSVVEKCLWHQRTTISSIKFFLLRLLTDFVYGPRRVICKKPFLLLKHRTWNTLFDWLELIRVLSSAKLFECINNFDGSSEFTGRLTQAHLPGSSRLSSSPRSALAKLICTSLRPAPNL